MDRPTPFIEPKFVVTSLFNVVKKDLELKNEKETFDDYNWEIFITKFVISGCSLSPDLSNIKYAILEYVNYITSQLLL